jgi:hypothetical protein
MNIYHFIDTAVTSMEVIMPFAWLGVILFDVLMIFSSFNE